MTPAGVDRIAVSPCSHPQWGLDEVLAAYAGLGYRQFEVFTSWAASRFDCQADPAFYRAKSRQYQIEFLSLHLPPVDPQHYEDTLAHALRALAFAAAIGVRIVLYKANDRPTYVRAARRVLDAAERLGVTVVIQNHCGTALTSLTDFRAVLDGVADPRLRTLLEVGHFHSAGIGWPEAAPALGDTIALVHLKDQIGRQSVPFGAGEIDLAGLLAWLDAHQYQGAYVVEMEVTDPQHTLQYLGDARRYLQSVWREETP